MREEFSADWAVMLRGNVALATAGVDVPDPSVLEALAAGTAASPIVAAGESGPDDLAVAPFPTGDSCCSSDATGTRSAAANAASCSRSRASPTEWEKFSPHNTCCRENTY